MAAPDTDAGPEGPLAFAVVSGSSRAEGHLAAICEALARGVGRPVRPRVLEAGAGINGAFVLLTAGPIPSDAIAFSRRLDAGVKAALVEQVSALPASVPEAVGKLLGADGFAPPPASHSEALRALAGARL